MAAPLFETQEVLDFLLAASGPSHEGGYPSTRTMTAIPLLQTATGPLRMAPGELATAPAMHPSSSRLAGSLSARVSASHLYSIAAPSAVAAALSHFLPTRPVKAHQRSAAPLFFSVV